MSHTTLFAMHAAGSAWHCMPWLARGFRCVLVNGSQGSQWQGFRRYGR